MAHSSPPGASGDDAADDAVRNALHRMVLPFLPSVDRWYSIVRREKSPMWAGLMAVVESIRPVRPPDATPDIGQMTEKDIEQAVSSLQRWSVDMIAWDFNNNPSLRWDVDASPYFARDSTNPIMRDILPPQERVQTHWNADPYAIGPGGGGGSTEFAPSEYELPYYLLLFFGAIQE